MDSSLSEFVQTQFVRPEQLVAAARAFPVVYIPFGLIGWNGRHLPLGNDATKAHAFLAKVAQEYGGVVYPPVYFQHGFGRQLMVSLLTTLFGQLKKTGFRVILRCLSTGEE